MPENPTARDGKPGCPVTVWDGPYSTRCGAGASVGKCAHHGPFATTARREAEDDPKHARMYRALLERAEKAERAVADARREALLEAEAQQPFRVAEANRVRAEKAEAKVARVEALAEGFRKSGFTSVYESAEEIAELIDRALAEPERDEEGGR